MIFLIVRILPFVVPAVYFVSLKSLFYFSGSWWWPLIFILAADLAYFLLLSLKAGDRKIFFLFLHSAVFAALGFVFTLLLSNPFFINLFLIFWALVYWIYLESVLQYFFRTKISELIDLKNIMAYLNLLMVFLAVASAINAYLFLNLAWWLVLILVFVLSVILFFDLFLVHGFELKKGAAFALANALILLEILIALLFFPTSFYFTAFVCALAYYLLSFFSVFFLNKALTRGLVLRYVVFAAIVLAIVSATTAWF